MRRDSIGLFIAAAISVFSLSLSMAQEPAPVVDDDDPLLRAIRELQRDVDRLREEIRGVPSSSRGRNPSMEPAALPSMPKKPALPATRAANSTSKPLKPTAIDPTHLDHWSFQRLRTVSAPVVADEGWLRDDLDRFILARLEEKQLRPNPDASKHQLIRRIAFDLTGLPPTVSEIRDFVEDRSSLDVALARVVDHYLESPRFGERWGRHWLDVVRYADSVGRNWNAPFTYAWRYRNYVIDAFNSDKPYDRFIIEQIAGDLLPADDVSLRREQIVATGFLALGPMNIIEPEGESFMMDRIDEQIDVSSRAFLGLTVSCARCHDHKYEPISMRDYYALAGVFYSTKTFSGQRRGNYVADDDLIVLPSHDGRTSSVPGIHSMADMTSEWQTRGWREVFYTTDPNLAMAAVEGTVQDCPIRIDGEAYKQGTAPKRGDFRIAGLSGLNGIKTSSSGRLEFARWLASSENPLTARVMVNRIWQHLFGRGLVETVDNLGVSGQTPSHPELLDHLATRFSADWSVKQLIRSIVLSRTYRLNTEGRTDAVRLDPQNELYWRMNIRRLEVEALRDAMLAASGRLTFDRPDGIQLAGTGGKGKWGETRPLIDIHSPYRTVYLPVLRSLLPEMYTVFDFPNPNQLQGQREVTTVAPQALFLMNSEFAVDIAHRTARRILEESNGTDAARIQEVYLLLLSRFPDKDEVDASLNLLRSVGSTSTRGDMETYRWAAFIQALMISGEFRSLL